MGDKNKKCGGMESYKWLISLGLQALIKVITAYLNKDKDREKERRKDSAALR